MLDETSAPVTIAEAIEHGRQQVLDDMTELAEREAKLGDSRALGIVTRYREMLARLWAKA